MTYFRVYQYDDKYDIVYFEFPITSSMTEK